MSGRKIKDNINQDLVPEPDHVIAKRSQQTLVVHIYLKHHLCGKPHAPGNMTETES